jgi:hypothetical protein
MNTKLSLSLDKEIIDKAKRYAKEHNRSLSQIVAKYLRYLTQDDEPYGDIDPEVADLSDNISLKDLPQLDDAKYQYLRDEYLNA